MKKMLFILVIGLMASDNYAFEDLQATPCTLYKQKESTTFLDVSSSGNECLYDEYFEQKDDVQRIDEYDQHITDNVNPPKVSSTEAMLKEMLAALLIRYIMVREMAHTYFTQIKETLIQWYHTIIKA